MVTATHLVRAIVAGATIGALGAVAQFAGAQPPPNCENQACFDGCITGVGCGVGCVSFSEQQCAGDVFPGAWCTSVWCPT
jgi:hypothetical protein